MTTPTRHESMLGAYNLCLGDGSGCNLTTGHHNILIGPHAGKELTTESYQIHITDWNLARDIFHIGARLCIGVALYRTDEDEVRQSLRDGEDELVRGAMKLVEMIQGWDRENRDKVDENSIPMTGKLGVH